MEISLQWENVIKIEETRIGDLICIDHEVKNEASDKVKEVEIRRHEERPENDIKIDYSINKTVELRKCNAKLLRENAQLMEEREIVEDWYYAERKENRKLKDRVVDLEKERSKNMQQINYLTEEQKKVKEKYSIVNQLYLQLLVKNKQSPEVNPEEPKSIRSSPAKPDLSTAVQHSHSVKEVMFENCPKKTEVFRNKSSDNVQRRHSEPTAAPSSLISLPTRHSLPETDLLNIEKHLFCTICKRVFQRACGLASHMRKHKSEGGIPEALEPGPVMGGNNKKQQQREKNQRTIRDHLPEHSTSPTESGREQLNNMPHKVNECCICDRRFSTPAALKKHIISHSGEKPYKCNVCFKSFAYQGSFLTHSKFHCNGKQFQCKKCKYIFIEEAHLKKHYSLTHKKSHRCFVCRASFAYKRFLKRHIQKVHFIFD